MTNKLSWKNWKKYNKKIPPARLEGFLNFEKLSQNFGKQYCQYESADAADDHFAHAVSHAFLEARKLVFAYVELADKHVEIAALVAHIHPQARRVIDDNDCERHGDGEGAGVDAFIVTDGSYQGNDESGVRAGHVSMSHGVVPIPAVLQGKNYEFYYLHDAADENRNEKDIVRRKKS